MDGNAVVESTAMSGDAASGTELNQEFLNTIEEAGLGDIAVEVGLVRGQPSSLLPPDLGHADHLGAVHSMAMLGDVRRGDGDGFGEWVQASAAVSAVVVMLVGGWMEGTLPLPAAACPERRRGGAPIHAARGGMF